MPNIGNMSGDLERFRQIIRGYIRQNIRKYIMRGDIVRLPKGKNATIPMPSRIKMPRFRFMEGDDGVGQGNAGGIGEPIAIEPEDREYTAEVSVQELLDILAEDLELPNLEPKPATQIEEEKLKYNSRSVAGPRSLVHKRESLKRAIMRASASGHFDPEKLVIEPRDFRYRQSTPQPLPHTQAVIFFIIDISGSISEEALEIIHIESFWLEQWITKFYPKTVIRFIAHDSRAKEVKREEFFTFMPGGSTRFLPPYRLVDEIILKDYPVTAWNIYAFHWSDGDGLESDINETGVLLYTTLLDKLNLLGYEQIEKSVEGGKLFKRLDVMRRANPNFHHKIRTSRIKNRRHIYQSLKIFLGKAS